MDYATSFSHTSSKRFKSESETKRLQSNPRGPLRKNFFRGGRELLGEKKGNCVQRCQEELIPPPQLLLCLQQKKNKRKNCQSRLQNLPSSKSLPSSGPCSVAVATQHPRTRIGHSVLSQCYLLGGGVGGCFA